MNKFKYLNYIHNVINILNKFFYKNLMILEYIYYYISSSYSGFKHKFIKTFFYFKLLLDFINLTYPYNSYFI